VDLSLKTSATISRVGEVSLLAQGRRQLRSQYQLTTAGPVQDGAGLAQAPRWRAHATLAWAAGPLRAGWSVSFIDAYWLNSQHAVDAAQGSAKVSSQVHHDVFVQWRSSSGNGEIPGTEVQLGLTNVMNSAPPLDMGALTTDLNRYSASADPRRAVYYVRFTKRFE
jgi:hypothetical protein